MFRQSCSRSGSDSFLSRLPFFLLRTAILLSAEIACARGMQVTSAGPQTVRSAEGESLTLGCSYTSGPSDTGSLDIEWSVVSPDTTQKDQMLVSYSGGATYVHASLAAAKGLSFAAADPSMGDASLSIARPTAAHSATYQCKVKKSPGVDAVRVSLLVMAKPSVPKCWVEGGQLVGEDLSLHCQSAGGSTPLKYTWRRGTADPIPAAATQNAVTGELRISNHSQGFAGIYLCEVNNAVGAERCRINLKANRPPNRAAVIVGTAVGSLLLIFILLVFVGLLYWKLSNRRSHEKEFSNEIREDVPPPESRPVSRRTSRSGSQRPRGTHGQVDGTEPSRARTPSTDGRGHTPAKYKPLECDCQDTHAV